MLSRYFRFQEHGTNIRTEVIAGVTTFMAMAYIIFIQPAVLSAAGMDFYSVFVATCLSAFIAALIMGIYANIPGFLTLIGISLTYSIPEGIVFGFISYPIVKLLSGKWRDVSWLIYVLAAFLILRYIFLVH